MKKKIAVIGICIVLALIAVAGGTMAYYTDSVNSQMNTITASVLDIKLVQLEKSMEESGAVMSADAAETENTETQSTTVMPGKTINQYTYVENTGTTSVYVRVKVLIPTDSAAFFDLTEAWNAKAIAEGRIISKAAALYNANRSAANPFDGITVDTRNNTTYYVFDFLYTQPLAASADGSRSITAEPSWIKTVIAQNVNSAQIGSIVFEADAMQVTGFEPDGNVAASEGSVTGAERAFAQFDGVKVSQ